MMRGVAAGRLCLDAIQRSSTMEDDSTLDYEPGVQRVLESPEETKAYYNKIARVYDLLADRAEEPMREAGLSMLDVQPGERVLEIGFGTGHCLVALARAVGTQGRVFGIDLAENMREISEERLQSEGLIDRVELTCGDARALPYGDGGMDAVFMSFTLELFDTPEIAGVLGECRRVLRPGGRIAVVSVSKEGKGGVFSRAFEWTHRHFPNLLDCRPIYVRRALEANGFELQQYTTERMWVPVEIVSATKPGQPGQ